MTSMEKQAQLRAQMKISTDQVKSVEVADLPLALCYLRAPSQHPHCSGTAMCPTHLITGAQGPTTGSPCASEHSVEQKLSQWKVLRGKEAVGQRVSG